MKTAESPHHIQLYTSDVPLSDHRRHFSDGTFTSSSAETAWYAHGPHHFRVRSARATSKEVTRSGAGQCALLSRRVGLGARHAPRRRPLRQVVRDAREHLEGAVEGHQLGHDVLAQVVGRDDAERHAVVDVVPDEALGVARLLAREEGAVAQLLRVVLEHREGGGQPVVVRGRAKGRRVGDVVLRVGDLDGRAIGNLAQLLLLLVGDHARLLAKPLHDDLGLAEDLAVGLGDVRQEGRDHALALAPLVKVDELDRHVEAAVGDAELGGLAAALQAGKVGERSDGGRLGGGRGGRRGRLGLGGGGLGASAAHLAEVRTSGTSPRTK
mmetsp:Transcript_3589/g.12041  ORF Transcript_3589/g.12041 Transcript_3589/m.12041 type:complete len:325 (-) Transcript_3589:163-1137(-)